MKKPKHLEVFLCEKSMIELQLSCTTITIPPGPIRNKILLGLLGIQTFIVPVFLFAHLTQPLQNGLNLNILMTILFSFGYAQIILKIICAAKKKKTFWILLEWIESLYRDEESDPTLWPILEKHLLSSLKIWKLLF